MNKDISLNKLILKYRKWISSNPPKCSEIESTVKWVSLLILNQYSNSNVLSELVFTLSNLLIFLNDRIILNSLPHSAVHKRYEDNLKIVVTFLEHCEIFIEITAKKLWGSRGKWIVVTFIQLFKSLSKIKLLYTYKTPLIECPPVPFLKRKELAEVYEEIGAENTNNNNNEQRVRVLMVNSGRIIRSINSDCSIENRSWKPVQLHEISPSQDKQFNNHQLLAEMIYITKPLAHLISMYYCGEKSWKPWILALSFDLTSLYLMRKRGYKYLSRRQKVDLTKRFLQLSFYVVRSPCYDEKSKQKIEHILTVLSNSIPLSKFVLNPTKEYLPHWQSIYFHTWSN